MTGPSTVLIRNDRVDFANAEGEESLGRLVERIATYGEALRISDIRSVQDPLANSAAKAAFPKTCRRPNGSRQRSGQIARRESM